MFTQNAYIKHSSTDSEGKYSEIGQFVELNGDMVVMTNPYGSVLNIPKDDGEFVQVDRPVDWSTPKVIHVQEVEVIKPKRVKSTRPDGAKSKADIVLELFTEHKPKSRKEGIALIVDLNLMSVAGASTYCSNANKILNLW